MFIVGVLFQIAGIFSVLYGATMQKTAVINWANFKYTELKPIMIYVGVGFIAIGLLLLIVAHIAKGAKKSEGNNFKYFK
jgi:hypothetical protein